MANVLGTMVVQDLTYTQAKHGINFTVTYVNGGVAGSEVVTLGDTDIIVKIASGTSTATQIRNAILAKPQALALVSVAISGTGSNVQVSAVRSFQSGGANAIAAALPVHNLMRLEAKTAGTGGNSIRFRFTSGNTGGQATVTVSVNDITCQIENGVTTYFTVKAAMDASSAAAALVKVMTPYDLHPFFATSSDMSSFTNLAGGTAASSPAVVIQDLTYTSTTSGPTSKRQSITYTIGATAGSEVVTLDANGSETIQIQNGVSTATQIKAAHDASAPALALRTVAITGTGSTAQKTVNELATIASEATPSTKDYFSDQTIHALTASFVAQPFGFHAESIIMYNDETTGSDYVEWSFNGTDVGGRLMPGEVVILDHLGDGRAVISLRSNAAADYRLEVAGV